MIFEYLIGSGFGHLGRGIRTLLIESVIRDVQQDYHQTLGSINS